MSYVVMLDAGHGGWDPGASYYGRQEKNDNLNLALAVGNILEQKGIPVIYTRTSDVYQTPFEKAEMANRSGCGFFCFISPERYAGAWDGFRNREPGV